MTRTPSKSSTCTKQRRRARGTAEIEAIFAILVLMGILFLAVSAARLASARMKTAQLASFEAFKDGTDRRIPLHVDDTTVPPFGGVGDIRPGLPSRMHVPMETREVELFTGDKDDPNPMKVRSIAALAAPAWSGSGWPVGGDESTTADWFTTFVEDSHGEVIDPLMLDDTWRP